MTLPAGDLRTVCDALDDLYRPGGRIDKAKTPQEAKKIVRVLASSIHRVALEILRRDLL